MIAKMNSSLQKRNNVRAEQINVKIFLVLMTFFSQVEHILNRDTMILLQTYNNCLDFKRLVLAGRLYVSIRQQYLTSVTTLERLHTPLALVDFL